MEEWAVELAAIDGVEGVKREIETMKAARERMISCNLRLVLHIARKKFYTGSSGSLKVTPVNTNMRGILVCLILVMLLLLAPGAFFSLFT